MDIAVIGTSIKNSVAEDMKEFHNSLFYGLSGSRCSAERRGLMTGIENHKKNMGNLRCMSDIEMFDYKFFGLSKREARRMSPEMRIGMEFFVKAVYDSGYSLASVRGSDMGIIMSVSGGEDYNSLFREKDAFTYMGSSVSAMVGAQLSYRFDLRGPVFLIDSACCSSALAVHDACMRLSAGESSVMAVGAVETALFVKPGARQEVDSVGVFTKKDYCCPVDEEADGIIPGEGCGFVILKPLENALRDNDYIYSVIRGSAVNSNGRTSRDITSPSKEAESIVIKTALKRAGLSPDDITECELHAAGTPIGDRIEFDTLAYIYGSRKGSPLPVGTVKSNVGHTGKVSGLSALLKVICGFENNVIYPIANLKNMDKTLDMADGKLVPLKSPILCQKGIKRIADIASYGINGTNVHLIVENYIHDEKRIRYKEKRFLKISAASEKSFYMYRDSLCEFFTDYKGDIDDKLFTLNTGRDDYKFRAIVNIDNSDNIVEQIAGTEPFSSPDEEIFSEWLGGKCISWNEFYKDGIYCRVPAPVYQFDHTVLWPFDI